MAATLDSYLETHRTIPGVLTRSHENRNETDGLLHMPREIAQQPFLWRYTARMLSEQAPALKAFLKAAGLYGDYNRPGVILTGAGTSDYVGLSLSDLLRTRLRTPATNWSTTRITATPDLFFSDLQSYIVIHFARSGDSPESRAVLEFALKHHCSRVKHIVITCNGDGELARIAMEHPENVFLIVLHEASNDKALAMTSSFSNMVIAGQALVHLDDMGAYVSLVDSMAAAAEQMIRLNTDRILEMADPRIRRVFYLGNSDLRGAAAESALKVQELTAGEVIAKSEDPLAFRHGPVSAVDRDTLVCFFLSENQHALRYELDVLTQFQGAFREIGARTIVVASRMPEIALESSVDVCEYDPDGIFNIPALYQVNLAVLFGQLFGLFTSFRLGLDVDNPSAEKALYSRTVQGVRLYEYQNNGGV